MVIMYGTANSNNKNEFNVMHEEQIRFIQVSASNGAREVVRYCAASDECQQATLTILNSFNK